tara:strand:- start:12212 stop:13561 length:1350 start_codon:yes stop_codon:yes gene_type:complete
VNEGKKSINYSNLVDPAFYASCYQFALDQTALPADVHFSRFGAKRGWMPRANVDPCALAVLKSAGDVAEGLDSLDENTIGSAYTVNQLARLLPSHSETGPVDFGGGGAVDMFSAEEVRKNRAAANQFGKAQTQSVEIGDAGYQLICPDVSVLLQKLESGEPFSSVKLPHGLWDAVAFSERLGGALRNSKDFECLTYTQIRYLGRRWARKLTPNNGCLVEGFIDDLFSVLSEKNRPENAYIGLALKGFPTHDGRLWHIPGDHQDKLAARFSSISQYFEDGYRFWDGTLFKRYAISGSLPAIMDAVRKRPSILIASQKLDVLPQRLNMPLMGHYKIPPSNIHSHRYEVFNHLCQAIEGMKQRFDSSPVVISQAGGSFAFWLLTRLQRQFPEATFMDMGQALNIWVLDRQGPMPWLKIYAESIVRNCGLGAYYKALGHADVLQKFDPAAVLD